jgi:hypothetical protein
MFIFKRSKVVVDCFTKSEIQNKLYPIDYASRFIPEDWKNLPTTVQVKAVPDRDSKLEITASTMKKCVGFLYLHSKGFIIPAWSDMAIEMMGEARAAAIEPKGKMDVNCHPKNLYWSQLYKGYSHIKLMSPWMIREKTGVKFTWNRCDWVNSENADKFHVVSAVIDFNTQYASHINVFQKTGSTVHIPAGTPLVHLIPITDKDLDLRKHVVSPEEYNRIYNSYAERGIFMGHHRAMQKYIEEEQAKCPFKKLFGA